MVTFLGDIHGHFEIYKRFVAENPGLTIQIGDFGLGFGEPEEKWVHYNQDYLVQKQNYFIRGNHDNPDVCRNLSCYLGEWGYFDGMFFVSGAHSIDKDMRTLGVDWWEDEELTYQQFMKCMDEYEQQKDNVRMVVSHDCPFFVYDYIHSYKKDHGKSITSHALEHMYEIHQPNIWVFGHHHMSFDFVIENTRFVCLGINEIKTIEVPR